MKHPVIAGRKNYIPSIPVRSHHVADEQMFLSSFHNGLVGHRKRSHYEKKRLVKMECVATGSCVSVKFYTIYKNEMKHDKVFHMGYLLYEVPLCVFKDVGDARLTIKKNYTEEFNHCFYNSRSALFLIELFLERGT